MAEENILLRIIDRIGFVALDGAAAARRRVQDVSTALAEQDNVARSILDKRREEETARKKEMKEKLSKIKDSVAVEAPSGPEDFEFEREELKVPFSVRISNLIVDRFSKYASRSTNFFGNIQEDLYKANIIMPVSRYVALSMGVSVIAAIGSSLLFSFLFGLFMGPAMAFIGLVLGVPVFFVSMIVAKSYPSSQVKGRSDNFGRALPFALKHMATQLVSGSGLLETMRSVGRSDYGVLSEEFRRAILEIDRGASVEEAFERMNLRIESEGLIKTSRQIASTLRTGGNLADTLKIISEEISMDMRMKLKDFIETLNMFGMMFMFIVIVAPVLMTTLVVAMGIAMSGLPIPASVMWMLYATFFGIGVFMAIMIKRMEPRV